MYTYGQSGLFQSRTCFIDLAPLFSSGVFNPCLPGYIRDLISVWGSVTGLILSGQSFDVVDSLSAAVGSRFFKVWSLDPLDAEGSVWRYRRSSGHDFNSCSFVFSSDEMEDLAKKVGIWNLRLIDRLLMPKT